MNPARHVAITFVKIIVFATFALSLANCGKVYVQVHMRNGGSRGSGILSRQWTVEDGTPSGSSSANNIAADSFGNIYVTGNTNSAGLDGNALIGNDDLIITKYNSSGTRQWTVEDGTPGGTTNGLGIAVDSSNNVYVTGLTSAGLDGNTLMGSYDLFITKYNSAGTRQWTVEDGTPGGFAYGQSITVDSSDNVYVAGYTQIAGLDGNTIKGSADLIITKYNSSGIRQWTVEDGTTGGTTGGFSIKLDSSGNVYVAGYTGGSAGLDGNALKGNQDLFATKYNSSGTRQWTVEDGTPGGFAFGYGIAVDSSGNAYLAGYTSGAGLDGNTLKGNQDIIITKYNSSGTRQWTVEDGTSGGMAYGYGIAVDSTDSAYVTGYTSGAGLDGNTLTGTQDLIISKYNSSGMRQQTIEDGTSGGTAYGLGVVVDLPGNVYLAGYTWGAGLDGNTLKGNQDIVITEY